MCLMSVKEEEAPVPARVTRVRRVVRRSPSPPPREVRITRQSFVEERKPSPPPQPEHRTSTTIHTEQRRVSRPPSSAAPSRSTQTHFVEVDHDSSSSEDDVRSRSTRKSSRSKSKPRTEAPASEYSMHEREFRRERGYSSPRPKQEYETYRYIEAPKHRSGSRGGYYEGPRASRDSFRRERMVVEDDYGRRRREYQR